MTINLVGFVTSVAAGNAHDAAFDATLFVVLLIGTLCNWYNRSRYDKMVADMDAERRQQLIRLTTGE